MTTWRGLAGALARRAGELRGLWHESGTDAKTADERAQAAICGLLGPWLAGGSGEFARLAARRGNTQALPTAVRAALRSVCKDLSQADGRAVWRELAADAPHADPITQFYESFLAAYAPEQRRRCGVFYTPRPVASFVVAAVQEALQKEFDWHDGLAQDKPGTQITIVDPAAGTGVFLVEVIEVMYQTLRARWRGEGLDERACGQRWRRWVSLVLPKRLRGYELMPAAAALANLNVALKLRATGCGNLGAREWVRTGNSLELLGDTSCAGTVAIVVGNPPYAIRSNNRHPRLDALLADYKQGLRETNLNALSDDYIKFFRLAHRLVVEAGAGVIGLVTNNSLLEGVTHRRMRALLLRDFERVQVVDLHGSVMRRQETPAGVVDESVFEIQQGVAISILTRTAKRTGDLESADRRGCLRRADLWGTRQHKYAQLAAGPGGLAWVEPAIKGPYFFFSAAGNQHDEYQGWPALTELFGVYSSGIKFRKDGLLVKNHFRRVDVEVMLGDVARLPADELTAKYGFRETADWQLQDKRAWFAEWRPKDIIAVTYRPFDVRYAFYPLDRAGRIIVRGDSRVELMRHVLTVPNIGLVFNRQVVGESVTHFLVSRRPVSHGTFYLGNKGQDYFAPLYLTDGPQRRTNLKAIRAGCTPEAGLHYLYAVVHSPTYRTRYAAALKVDFPRVPLPGSASLFAALGQIGADLVGLHLLEEDYAEASWKRRRGQSPCAGVRAKVCGDGIPIVARGYPRYYDQRVYLNANAWIDEVPENIWAFQVGGYTVCAKWLKDRRGRELSAADITHYRRIVRVFAETIRLMGAVDRVIDEHGGWSRAFQKG